MVALEDKLDRPGPGLLETLVENLSQDDHCWQRFCSVLKVINLQSVWLLHFVSQSWKKIVCNYSYVPNKVWPTRLYSEPKGSYLAEDGIEQINTEISMIHI